MLLTDPPKGGTSSALVLLVLLLALPVSRVCSAGCPASLRSLVLILFFILQLLALVCLLRAALRGSACPCL